MLDIVAKFFGSRWFQFVLLPIFVFVWFFATDPSHGADTLLRLQLWAQAVVVTGFAYLIAKSLLGNASSQRLYDDVLTNKNTAAGLAYVGVCLLRALVLFALLFFFAQLQR